MIEIFGKPTLPDFVIVGAQKCGTTSLLSYIGQHSRVRLGRKKATHYFDYNFEKGGTWYAKHFPRSAVFPFRGGEGKRNWLTGESCPSYVFLPEVPPRMKDTVPDAKVIVVLRDPVKRLVSHYFHERRKQRTNSSFEQFIASSLEQDWPASGTTREVLEKAAVPRGFYLAQLRHLREFYPASQTLVVSFEKLVANPDSVMAKIFGFLGLPSEPVNCSQVLNKGVGGQDPVIDEKTLVMLRALYARENRGLSDFAGAELGWS